MFNRTVVRAVVAAALLCAAFPAMACRPFGSYQFVEDKDGGIWFTEGDNNAVSRLAPDGSVKAYPLPTPNAEPTSLARDRNGNIWFAEMNVSKIGRLGSDGRIVEYPTEGGQPGRVTTDARGEAWFTQMAHDHAAMAGGHAGHMAPPVSKIGRITADGRMIDYPLSEGWPTSVVVDSSDQAWVTVLVPGDSAPRATQAIGKLARLDRDGRWNWAGRWENSCPGNLLAEADGGIVYADHCRGVVERRSRDGKLQTITLPPRTSVRQMALGVPHEGTLWLTEPQTGELLRIGRNGKTESIKQLDNGNPPFAIFVTSRGDVIFSEAFNYNINRLGKDGVLTEHLIRIDERRGTQEVREGEVCYVKFASRIVAKAEMDKKRAGEVKNGHLKPDGAGTEKLAEQKCLVCHDARRLLLSRRSDWTPSITRMHSYRDIRKVEPLTADETRTLVRYFNTYYGIGR